MKNTIEPETKTKFNPVNNGAKSGTPFQFSLKSFFSNMLLAVLPYLISLVLWYLVVELLDLWKREFNLLLLSYGIIIFFFSLLISFVITDMKKWLGIEETKTKKKKPATKVKRVFRIVVSGFLIPIILSATAYMVPVQGEDTIATLLIRKVKSQPEITFVEKVGETVITSISIDTKVAGIEALATIQTDEALDQLIKILDSEGCTHEYEGDHEYHLFSDALTKTFASYESEAIEPLLVIFGKCDEQIRDIPSKETKDLYTAYFEKTFDDIAFQIMEAGSLSSSEEEEVLARLNMIENQLILELLDLERTTSLTGNYEVSETTLDLILGSFHQMEKIEKPSTLYNLSRRIADDPSYSYNTRSNAIALIAKFGTRKDLTILLLYLNEDNETIKEAALEAIEVLSNKVEGNP